MHAIGNALTYDYIIVGAGSAGCVLANRLSADPAVQVLLLEAGGSDRRKLEIRVPAAFSKLFKTRYDWAYYTAPEPHLNNRRLFIPRGRVLGGSSSINAMIYIRGNALDFDEWAEYGGSQWGYRSVLPYFLRSEDQQRGASPFHGVGGPQRVSDQRCVNPLSRAFVAAAEEIGIARNEDFNAAHQEGVGIYQVTQKNGRRFSAADAYLRPVLGRNNLHVVTGASATRIVFEGLRAVGVEYGKGRELLVARASLETILCGGAINSPQLLMRSGIGPQAHIQQMGIPLVQPMPGVGENLQDHPALGVAYQCREPVSLDQAETFWNLLNAVLRGQGPLTSCVAEAGGFVRTEDSLVAPDVQFHFAPAWFVEHGFVRPAGYGFTIGPTLLRPRSRGRVRLGESADTVAIEGNFLQDKQDMTTMVNGLRLARRIGQAASFDRYRGREDRPGPACVTEQELSAYVRREVEMLYHPVGTCRMGSDEMAVVDGNLTVRGVTGLRVVDASVMPVVTRGNTNAATTMIGEKAADMILDAPAPRAGSFP